MTREARVRAMLVKEPTLPNSSIVERLGYVSARVIGMVRRELSLKPMHGHGDITTIARYRGVNG